MTWPAWTWSPSLDRHVGERRVGRHQVVPVADQHDGPEAAERLGDQRDLARRRGLHRRCPPARRSRRRSGSRRRSARVTLPETGGLSRPPGGVRSAPRFGRVRLDRGGDVRGQRRRGARRRRHRRALAGLGVGGPGRDAVGVADDRDQQLLVLADREVGAEAVPRGERRHRDAVEPGDRVGGLARLDAVAHRVDQRLGLAVAERVVGGARRPSIAAAALLGRQPSGWVVTVPASSPAGRPRHAVGQEQHLAGAQAGSPRAGRCGAASSVGRGADPARDAGEGVAVARDRHLVGGVGDDAARVGRGFGTAGAGAAAPARVAAERVVEAAAAGERRRAAARSSAPAGAAGRAARASPIAGSPHI